MRFRAVSLSVAAALLLAGCAGAPQQPGSSAPTEASASSGATAEATQQGVARRAGWRVEIPTGWVAVNREQLEAMPAEQVDALASKMSVEGSYLQRLQEHEAFELYAADPLNPAEMRVAYSPERLIPTREVIQALASEFQGRDVELGSMDSGLGRLGMATFLAGDKAAPVFGVILIGDGADEGSTAVIYILADSAEEAAKLAQSTAASMERA